MAGILLLHGDDGKPVGTAFRRQIEIDNFRKLLLQDWNEHLVQRHSENRRLVRWPASIGAVILDGEQQDVEQVLSCLNMSVALAKQKGRNRVQVYQSDDKQLLQHASEMDAVHHLTEAIKNNNLVLFKSDLDHCVRTHQDDSTRITLAYNFFSGGSI